jgi:hypothetical protein
MFTFWRLEVHLLFILCLDAPRFFLLIPLDSPVFRMFLPFLLLSVLCPFLTPRSFSPMLSRLDDRGVSYCLNRRSLGARQCLMGKQTLILTRFCWYTLTGILP